eukprot:1193768-Prorocentrum_minimum.AAC.5
MFGHLAAGPAPSRGARGTCPSPASPARTCDRSATDTCYRRHIRPIDNRQPLRGGAATNHGAERAADHAHVRESTRRIRVAVREYYVSYYLGHHSAQFEIP